MFEIREHTADLALHVTAADFPGLCADAVRGLLAVLVENPETVGERAQETVEIQGRDEAYLLVDLLDEVLYRFAVRHQLVARCTLEARPEGLRATLYGEPVDPARHRLVHEVKAITYHELAVRVTPSGRETTLVLDI